MPPPDGTLLNNGTGGDTIQTEQPGGVGVKYPVTKIYTGASGVNGGPVTSTNPLDVRVDGAAGARSDGQRDDIILLLTEIRNTLWRAFGQ